MKGSYFISRYLTFPRFAIGSLAIVGVALFVQWPYARAAVVSKSWSGNGATNNWSEATNWNDNVVPGIGDTVTFDGTSVKNATIDVNINVGGFQISSGYTGTVTQAPNATIADTGQFTQSGGTFNGGNGNIDVQSNFILSGGTFTSTSGTLTIGRTYGHQGSGGGLFIHNGGTVTFNSQFGDSVQALVSGDTFNNVNFNYLHGTAGGVSNTAIVLGTLNLNDGGLSGGFIDARGPVNFSPNFEGGPTLLMLTGMANRTVTLDAAYHLLNIDLNAPNTTINTTGSSALNWQALNLEAGAVNQGNVDFTFSSAYNQSGGVFNASSHAMIFNNQLILSGGMFNGGSGDITVVASSFVLSGGTFTSTNGTFFVGGVYDHHSGTGGTFNHNNGTVTFNSQSVFTASIQPPATGERFNNVNFSYSNGTQSGLSGTLIALGAVGFNDGSLSGGTVEARGSVTVGPNFDGGSTALTFSGSGNQTFANNGSPNLTGIWTIDKSSGIVTASTSMILGTGQPLNITSGGVHLGSGSALTAGSLTLGAAGELISDTATTITLGGNVVNNGLIDLYATGSECTGSGFRILQSSLAGTTRNWSGNGVFRLVHVNVVDQGGTAQIRVHDGMAGGTTGGNWTFDANCKASALHTPFDFDGDGKTDVAMFRPSAGEWWISRSTLGLFAQDFGSPTDKITPADFDGDGLTDIAIWREAAQATFIILESSTNTLRIEDFGLTGDDTKIVADWDGDGKADVAVFRHGAAGQSDTFFYRGSNNNPSGNITFIPWGSGMDRPVRGDFDGDGKADAAVFKSDGTWWIRQSSTGTPVIQFWGLATDKPVDGDFDGDGKSDVAVFRPSDTNWYILQSSNNQIQIRQFGLATDILTPGDYDGDGKTDLSIFRPSNGQTWIFSSVSGTTSALTFGLAGDIPTASAYE